MDHSTERQLISIRVRVLRELGELLLHTLEQLALQTTFETINCIRIAKQLLLISPIVEILSSKVVDVSEKFLLSIPTFLDR